MCNNPKQSIELRLKAWVEIDPDDPYLLTPIPDFQPDSEPNDLFTPEEIDGWPDLHTLEEAKQFSPEYEAAMKRSLRKR